MNLREIVRQARVEGGFDATEATVQGWAMDRYRRLVGESQWRREEISFGTTVAGTVRYLIPASVVDLRALKVGSAPYLRVSVEDLWEVKAGEAWVFDGGVFAPAYSDSETNEWIEIYPAPTTSGDAITGLAAVIPLDLGLDSEPAVPTDFHHVIVEGTIADGLGRIDERLDQAQAWEAMFAAGVEKLRRRRVSRVGSGPVRIRVGR